MITTERLTIRPVVAEDWPAVQERRGLETPYQPLLVTSAHMSLGTTHFVGVRSDVG